MIFFISIIIDNFEKLHLIKRHGRVSALKCMRETDRVSIREPASCEQLRLSDLNNGSAD